MPGKDATGPLGAGPMTGRGAGRCAKVNLPENSNAIPGQGPCGRGRGRRGGAGRGRGRGRGATPFVDTPGTDDEQQLLGKQAQALQAQLDAIKIKLESMGGADSTK
jgi:hypothetical protein